MKYIFAVLVLILSTLHLLSQENEQLYLKGQELYRIPDNEGAGEAFLLFLSANPNSRKADDAMWYLGRISNRMNDPVRAEYYFREVLATENSNRLSEAFSDLARILDKQDREEELIELLPFVIPDELTDKYTIKTLPLILKSYYLVGLRYRRARLGNYTEELWNSALELIALYEKETLSNQTQEILSENKARYLIRLADLSPAGIRNQDYYSRAGLALDEFTTGFPDARDKISSLKQEYDALTLPDRDFDYKLEVSSVYNGLANRFGLNLDSRISGGKEIMPDNFLEWKFGYSYDQLKFKTFNFNPVKSGNDRYFEWSHRIAGRLSLESGSKYFAMHTFSVGTDVSPAEDPGSMNYGFDAQWDWFRSFGSVGTFSLDNTIAANLFPDYLNAGRELNNIRISTVPEYTFVFSPIAELSVGYGFDYKYYLNAHFDTASTVGGDPGNRQYFIHKVFTDYKWKIADPLRLKVEYDFEVLHSLNYDLQVTGTPTDQFVTNIFDYFRTGGGIRLDVRSGPYTGKISGDFHVRRFFNYPSRTATQAFTGELRQDTEWAVSLENELQLFQSDSWGELGLFVNASYSAGGSTHTYEVSYLTNYTMLEVSIGLLWQD